MENFSRLCRASAGCSPLKSCLYHVLICVRAINSGWLLWLTSLQLHTVTMNVCVYMSVSWNGTQPSKTYPLSWIPAFVGISKADVSVWIHTTSNPMWKKVFYSSSLHSHVILCHLVFMELSSLGIKSAENTILLKRFCQIVMVPVVHDHRAKLLWSQLPFAFCSSSTVLAL